ncbi:hypothetical protein BWI97_22495 [Siphonobacter sp. BAB-5405]|nr:hypothetical protein BWI97_22495 [Siphonobacter sp. BAB-5405]
MPNDFLINFLIPLTECRCIKFYKYSCASQVKMDKLLIIIITFYKRYNNYKQFIHFICCDTSFKDSVIHLLITYNKLFILLPSSVAIPVFIKSYDECYYNEGLLTTGD